MASKDNITTPAWLSQVDREEARRQRGLDLAAANRVKKTSTGYRVRSSSQNKYYTIDEAANRCTCQDFAERQRPCKHVFAVRAHLAVGTSDAPVTPAAGTHPPARKKPGRPRKSPPIEQGQLDFLDRQPLLADLAGKPAPRRDLLARLPTSNSGPEPDDFGPAATSIPAPPKPPAPASGTIANDRPEKFTLDTPVQRGEPSVFQFPVLDTPVFINDRAGVPVIANSNAGLTSEVPILPTVRPVGNVGPKLSSRNYANYNLALETQKDGFLKLLSELCDGIEETPQGMGRPKMPLADMVFAATYKVFTGFSLRRFNSDLKQACNMGYVSKKPKFNTLSEYFASPDLTPILMDLITASALALKGMDNFTLPDSSGFSTDNWVRWYAKKHEGARDTKEWVKVHLTCGNITKIVTAVVVTGWEGTGTGDSGYFVPLLERTRQYFDVEAVAADKAYLSAPNLDYAMSAGITPFIPFKTSTRIPTDKDGSAWAMMYHYFRFHEAEFLEYYHQRSAVETAFDMIKRKFGGSLRSRNPVAQVNEVLCKVLCHNIAEVHKASVMLGFDPVMDAKLPKPRTLGR